MKRVQAAALPLCRVCAIRLRHAGKAAACNTFSPSHLRSFALGCAATHVVPEPLGDLAPTMRRPGTLCARSRRSLDVRSCAPLHFAGYARQSRDLKCISVSLGRSSLAGGGSLFPPCLRAFSPYGAQSPAHFQPCRCPRSAV